MDRSPASIFLALPLAPSPAVGAHLWAFPPWTWAALFGAVPFPRLAAVKSKTRGGGKGDHMFGGLISWRAFSGGRRARRDLAGGGCARLIALPSPVIPQNDGDLEDGVWPDDPDIEPAWVTRQFAKAETVGITLPPIRTRRALEEAIERCRIALSAPPEIETETVPVEATMLPEHTGPEAAELFLAHLRATVSRPQRFSSDELAAAYASWCAADQRRAPTPENVMRGALKRLRGVSRIQESTVVDGRRVRSFVWTVSPAETVAKTVAKPSIVPEMEAAA